ncbi:MAG: succinate--CoA ligase subunit alpha [Candidatus Dormiibacterota bacterium]
MSVLVDLETRVVVQGITGRQAAWSTADLVDYGTKVVAGVVPGKGGQEHAGIPIFNHVDEAVRATSANAALTYVPARLATEAIGEALDAGLRLIVYPGDGLPMHDAYRLRVQAQRQGSTLVGPNTPGVISPGQAKLGFMPSFCYSPGHVGVVTKSGSLSYEVCRRLTQAAIGQSTVVGIGGDPIKGATMREVLDLFHDDDATAGIVVLGEIGGMDEYDVCSYAERAEAKPVVAFLVGKTAPENRKLGHASALVDTKGAGYAAKVSALRQSGVPVAEAFPELVVMTRDRIVGGMAR